MVAEHPSIFRPFLQEFFVKAADPLFTCKLKLDVLTALATRENCATILGELQTYVLHRDKSFVCAAVRAVGRVADARPEVADQCLQVRERGGSEGWGLEAAAAERALTSEFSALGLRSYVEVRRGGVGVLPSKVWPVFGPSVCVVLSAVAAVYRQEVQPFRGSR